jgi:hypothetical protein
MYSMPNINQSQKCSCVGHLHIDKKTLRRLEPSCPESISAFTFKEKKSINNGNLNWAARFYLELLVRSQEQGLGFVLASDFGAQDHMRRRHSRSKFPARD